MVSSRDRQCGAALPVESGIYSKKPRLGPKKTGFGRIVKMPRTFHLMMALTLLVSVAWCQGNLGGLTGRIADSTGAGVPAVALKITNIDTAAEVHISSSSDG